MPDAISSDLHVLNLLGPLSDQATILSKFPSLDIPLPAVIRSTTANAAPAIRRTELGTPQPSSAGDATIFTIDECRFPYFDSVGEQMIGGKKIRTDGIELNGDWWHPAGNI